MPWLIVRLPCGSRSTHSTRWPRSAKAAARLSVVVVLATPPFWLVNAMTCALASHYASAVFARAGRNPSLFRPVTPLLDKRLLVVTGKGGVGKTTVAVALGLAAARAASAWSCARWPSRSATALSSSRCGTRAELATPVRPWTPRRRSGVAPLPAEVADARGRARRQQHVPVPHRRGARAHRAGDDREGLGPRAARAARRAAPAVRPRRSWTRPPPGTGWRCCGRRARTRASPAWGRSAASAERSTSSCATGRRPACSRWRCPRRCR